LTTHVATVHWRDDRWIDVQLRYLERFLPQPYKVYAFLNHIEVDHSDRFFYSSDERIKEHSTKLNLLADMITFNAASDDDQLLFIDGDAFPIADLGPLITDELPRHKLIAVRRDEATDVQPHPCFCLTTVGFWRQLGGDWRKGGHSWTNAAGREVSDVGARVLKAVDDQHVDWKPMLRSNKNDPHPLFFGVYDDLVYHHGAGFRRARGGRLMIAEAGVHEADKKLRTRIIRRLPANKWTRPIRQRFNPARNINKQLKDQIDALSGEWFDKIQSDPEFFRELTEPAPASPA
jgi:hypothetical protein